jgi:very-short-patch-repair endonuclease
MTDLVDRVHRVGAQCRPRQQSVAALAALQHGVASRWQLLLLGLTRRTIEGWIAAGRLHRLYLGVYAVGHRRLTTKGRWMAAVLACGPDAVLSHRAAVALWDLRPAPPAGAPVDVTVPGRSRRGQKGIRVHNVRALHDDDRTVLDGIPVTAVHRALLDFAEQARVQQLRLALEAADRRELLDLRRLEQLRARSPGRRGLKPLNAVVAVLRGPAPWTRSELERAFLALIRDAGLPEPQANVLVEGFNVDFWWPEQRLVVEIDSYGFHTDRRRFVSDRFRDTKLQLANCRVLRVTQPRIEPDPRELLSDLTQALSGRAAGAGASGR